ncbi:MAG: outer membrane lipoprotein carrier protein LolA [Bacteroidales bacterium]|jgi:outer membrane lipoprotein-sorting protein|nr:outer membrane lipoprotein carrier protein LolA [Bacteroidales bacterium]
MKSKIFIIVFAFATVGVFAQKELTADLKQKIKEHNSAITTLNCRFKQTKHLAIMSKDLVSTGQFYYQQKDKLSMQYDTPAGDLMTMNGTDFLMITNGKRRVASSKSNAKLKTLQVLLTACMNGDIDAAMAQTAATAVYTDNGKNYIIKLTPKKADLSKGVVSIVLTVNKQSMEITALRIDETADNYTLYELSNRVVNKPIDAKVFEIKAS